MTIACKFAASLLIAVAAALTASHHGGSGGTAAAQAAAAAPSAIRITSPKDGQQLKTQVVDVRFEVVDQGVVADPTPTFQVRLDDGSPVATTSTEQTFTGVKPGAHRVAVQAVDANNVPLRGTLAEAQFVVLPESEQPSGAAAGAAGPGLAASPEGGAGGKPAALEQEMPESSTSLPLLAIIGFGVLAGGITSAMRAR